MRSQVYGERHAGTHKQITREGQGWDLWTLRCAWHLCGQCSRCGSGLGVEARRLQMKVEHAGWGRFRPQISQGISSTGRQIPQDVLKMLKVREQQWQQTTGRIVGVKFQAEDVNLCDLQFATTKM